MASHFNPLYDADMVTAKQAAVSASEYVRELIDGSNDFRLEEVVRDERKPLWRIVVSFRVGEGFDLLKAGRLFKEVDVDADSGQPTSLRIWKA